MEFYYSDSDDEVLIIRADGGLNKQTADGFLDDLGNLIDAGLRKIVLDCSSLDYVSSYGLSVLLRLHRRLAKRGGDVKIAAAKGMILQVIEVARLNTLFSIYPDVEQAREAFGQSGEGDEAGDAGGD